MKNELIVDESGTKRYYLNNKYHREDGPAIEFLSGTKLYYIHGKLHREGNLPACEWSNGEKQWRIHGLLHRENGPALECANGGTYYYINGFYYSEEYYWNIIKRIKSLNYILSNLKKNA